MRKTILLVALGFILSVGISQAAVFNPSVVTPAPIIHHLVDAEAIGPEHDPAIPEEETVEPAAPTNVGSTPLWIILAGYCKEGTIEYSEWSECNHNFGVNGFMYRSILSTPGNCLPTTNQQVATVSECNIIE